MKPGDGLEQLGDSGGMILHQKLIQGLESLELTPDPEHVQRLEAFLDLLVRWNRVYNLTSIRERDAMFSKHLLDSLSVHRYITGPRVLDVGSGAGLPGIPLAIIAPTLGFVLLDSSNKKTRFIRQAVIELGLENVDVQQQRIESFDPGYRFDTVISRAFAALGDFVTTTGRLLGANGRLLAMKGRYPEDELDNLPEGFGLQAVHSLQVSGLDAERHLVEMVRNPL